MNASLTRLLDGPRETARMPKTCPGCDAPATTADLVSGANKFQEYAAAVFGGGYDAVKTRVPMCAARARFHILFRNRLLGSPRR